MRQVVDALFLVPDSVCSVPHMQQVDNSRFTINKKSVSPRDTLFLFISEYKSYPNMLNIIPAATAEPITPATFGPIACINK